uniref:Mitochondrial splicing suppressor 51-like C-terminal domain-containing protein n=1 Tax=Fibrocapsa japonica TaxID=94617 RepID=A0A7S2XZC1_9STRA
MIGTIQPKEEDDESNGERFHVKLNTTNKSISVKPENMVVCNYETKNMFSRVDEHNDSKKLAKTIVIALFDLNRMGLLPDISETGNKLTVLFAGASEKYETNADYSLLYEELQRTYYPTLETLSIVLCGPELPTPARKKQISANVEVATISLTVEKAYKRNCAASMGGFISCLIVPGFTTYLDPWTPGINCLLELGIPTIVTCYSDVESVTDDALFDMDVMIRYFGANILIPMSKNPHYLGRDQPVYKNAYYFVFAGRDEEADRLIVPAQEFKISLLSGYMRFQCDYYRKNEPSYAKACNKIAKYLENGQIPFKNQSTDDLVRLANIMMLEEF